jgi:hypothetical protein
MDTKLSVLFHGKRTKSQNASLLAIYLRITIDGQRMEISIKRTIEKFSSFSFSKGIGIYFFHAVSGAISPSD